MATYQVPVWFNIEADNQHDAWERVTYALRQVRDTIYEREPMIDDYSVEEPVHIELIQDTN